MSLNVLVTGGTGKTGRPLVTRLVERGAAVRVASRNPGPKTDGVEPVRFDWFDETTHPAALDGIDAVYIVSPLADSLIDPVPPVASLMDRARAAGTRRVVLLSSFGVERTEPTDTLRRLELAVEEAGVPTTILRPGAFMQNFSERHPFRLAEGIRERDEIAMPGGEHRISYISARDIAEVAAIALTEDGHEGKGYTLTGPEALTLAEVAGHVSAAAGRRVRYVETGPEGIREAVLAYGGTADFAGFIARVYTALVLSDAMAEVTDDVAAVTGRPATRFEEFAERAADAWRR